MVLVVLLLSMMVLLLVMLLLLIMLGVMVDLYLLGEEAVVVVAQVVHWSLWLPLQGVMVMEVMARLVTRDLVEVNTVLHSQLREVKQPNMITQ